MDICVACCIVSQLVVLTSQKSTQVSFDCQSPLFLSTCSLIFRLEVYFAFNTFIFTSFWIFFILLFCTIYFWPLWCFFLHYSCPLLSLSCIFFSLFLFPSVFSYFFFLLHFPNPIFTLLLLSSLLTFSFSCSLGCARLSCCPGSKSSGNVTIDVMQHSTHSHARPGVIGDVTHRLAHTEGSDTCTLIFWEEHMFGLQRKYIHMSNLDEWKPQLFESVSETHSTGHSCTHLDTHSINQSAHNATRTSGCIIKREALQLDFFSTGSSHITAYKTESLMI